MGFSRQEYWKRNLARGTVDAQWCVNEWINPVPLGFNTKSIYFNWKSFPPVRHPHPPWCSTCILWWHIHSPLPIFKKQGGSRAVAITYYTDFTLFYPPPGQGLPCVPWAAPKDTCLPCHGMRVSSAPPPVLPRQIRVHPAKSYQKRLPDAQDHVSSGIIQWVQIKHVPAVGSKALEPAKHCACSQNPSSWANFIQPDL